MANTFSLFSIDKPPNNTKEPVTPSANLAANLTRAVVAYKRRQGHAPNVVTINRADVPDGFTFPGLRVEAVEDIILKKQFRLWKESKENE